MELKTARLTLLIDPAKKAAFERLCARQDQTPSQVVRRLIRDYLTQHGVAYVPSGAAAPPEVKRPSPRSPAAGVAGAAPAGAAKARKRG
ncbi:MAG: ribbon-helix-helix protein, CopG family [Caldimonas sp.]